MTAARLILTAALLGAVVLPWAAARASGDEQAGAKNAASDLSIYDVEVTTIDGQRIKLEKYKGDVMLIVNVASKCGLTDRTYRELEPMYQKYKDRGLRVLGFPANDFLAQEPGTDQEIKEFCTKDYGVTFDLFSKVSVKGDDMCALYAFLTSHPNSEIAGPIQWNFQKYLVDREGRVIAKFSPKVFPSDEKLISAVEAALGQGPSESAASSKGS